jgi:predicted transcriptional regulator
MLAMFCGMEEVPMSAPTVREEAHRLVEQLPDDATWEDLLYQIYVRQSIEAGLADCEAGRLVPVEEVRRGLGLPT